MRSRRNFSLSSLRRLSQLFFVILFLILFRKTDYAGTDQLPYAVNIFFRLDPLVAASVMLGAEVIITLVLYSVIVVFLTLLFGRFFCGWVCPLGSLLDLCHGLIPQQKKGSRGRFKSWKYLLLTLILTFAFFGLPLVGYFDPFSILVRSMTIVLDPFLYWIVSTPFDFLYKVAPGWITKASELIYAQLKQFILPYNQKVYTLTSMSLIIFLLIFALEKVERRFWCRNLCPLGGLLALLSRFSFLRGYIQETCNDCQSCNKVCRMEAIDSQMRIIPEDCNLCLDCRDLCLNKSVSFKFKRPSEKLPSLGVSRRAFVGTLFAGIILPAFFKVRADTKMANPSLIRPPGAINERKFLNRCIRCGGCMKVCPTNALHPSLFEAGAEGIFAPRLIPRIGFCEFNCTLCGQVCPTGAINRLVLKEKQKTVIGTTYFDKNRCLPYAKGIPCIVCEEHCPTPDKAIKLREAQVFNPEGKTVTIKQPYLIDRFCIGCGICENKCPVEGTAAVIVLKKSEKVNLPF
ncbi:MAG: 4Fe-4S binding protein [Thermodesulfobacteriota bacterium]|jgi:MauM/NapG family ferredoxin protein|nr:MAG: 4Fe-4S binding protein [Thermodesulfobacteriota bacterium]